MKSKEVDMNLFYIENGQDEKIVKERKNKNKERENRIKHNKKQEKEKDQFDLETETVINMTNQNKIKKEEQKRKKIIKEEIKRKKRKKKIKFIIKIVISLAIIIGGIIFAMTSPIFNINKIEIVNNAEVSSEAIISLSELKLEENIFKFKKSDVDEKIKENAYIEDVKIRRILPNCVQIDVKERTPQYSVDFMGKYVYINSQGYFLEISEDNKGLPIIQGITTLEEDVILNKRLCYEDLEKLEDVIKIMDIARENGLENKITYIDIKDKNQYCVYMKDEDKKIYIGDKTNLSNKMIYIVALIEKEEGKAGEIFVNGDLNNKFQPYFREKIEI